MTTQLSEFADGITHGMFASRDSVQEAYDYAMDIAGACGNAKFHVMTALHVLMNAIADELRRIDEQGNSDTGGRGAEQTEQDALPELQPASVGVQDGVDTGRGRE